jgi:photosystem II stability/assembly factor-like uncharacterized protein
MARSVHCRWERVGTPVGGAVTALAVSPSYAHDATAIAATMAGLFRSRDGGSTWSRVGIGFTGLSLTALAVSPDFARDGLVLVASLEGGLLRVTGDGAVWASGDFQGRHVDISALAIAPDFARTGVAFAATMADGVYISRNRGANWEACTFGLLDLDVTALALSPSFERDETLFATTATGIFRSPNAGRAWREAGFPEDTPAVLCLAISPEFGADRLLFAGTDGAGLFRSCDRGATWQPAGSALRDACVNAVVLSPNFPADGTLLMATDCAVYVSRDAGESWSHCVQAPGALCLAVAPTFPDGGPVLVGLSAQGVLRSAGDLSNWQVANDGLSGRRLTGLTLSPRFAADRLVAAFGTGEGVTWSADGGATWLDTNDSLPSLRVADAAIGSRADGRRSLYVALPEGIWMCRCDGGTWEQIGNRPARLLAPSPAIARDGTMIVGTDDGGVWMYEDSTRQWQRINVPWPEHEILALATSPAFERDRRVFAAIRRPALERVEVWQGTLAGGWRPILEYESAIPRAAFAVLGAPAAGERWYAAIGERFYGPLGLSGTDRRPAGASLTAERPHILGLAALAEGVLAATKRGVYVLADGEWRSADEQEVPRPIVAVAAVRGSAETGTAYALEVGGALWRLHLTTDEYRS